MLFADGFAIDAIATEACVVAEVGFDVAASAGAYSAVAGLLAGFAFVSVLLPLDHDADVEDDRQTGHAVVVFVCAFFSLLILGLTYAILAGRTGDGPAAGVAAHEQMVNGMAFGLSVLLLLYGLRAVLGAYGKNRLAFEPARRLVLVVASVLGPVVLLAFQFSNALDVQAYRTAASGQCAPHGLPPGSRIDLALTLAALFAVVGLAFIRHRVPRSAQATQWLAKTVLGITCAFVAWSSVVVPMVGADVVTSAAVQHATVAISAVLTVAFAAASWAGR